MRKEIKYIGYYDNTLDSKKERFFSPAAKSKMDYVFKVLNECGYNITCVSCCRAKKSRLLFGKLLKLNEYNKLLLFTSLGGGGRLGHVFDYYLGKMQLFIYLLLHIKKDELVIVYHSLGYGNIINIAKKIKRFRVVLEVEEVYQDAIDLSLEKRVLEYRLFSGADKFIFPSALLREKINKNNLPSILIHGNYSFTDCMLSRFDDQCIHVIYAGTFERRKGGAIAAIEAAEFLTAKYHVHILGFGSDKEVEEIISLIKSVNNRSMVNITYHGKLMGVEYDNMLNSCHIGLSTQNSELAFNDTSFPSKILSYMGHGLQVVSARTNVVETSAVAYNIEYYEESTPRAIAEAIMRVNVKQNLDNRVLLKKLHNNLIAQMPIILK